MVNKPYSRLWFGKPWRSGDVPAMQSNIDVFTNIPRTRNNWKKIWLELYIRFPPENTVIFYGLKADAGGEVHISATMSVMWWWKRDSKRIKSSIRGERGQYCVYWWSGSLCHSITNSHINCYLGLTYPVLTKGGNSASHAISVLRNNKKGKQFS